MTSLLNSEIELAKMVGRVLLHLRCPCSSWQQTRFHLTGIIREFAPSKWQQFIH